MIFCYKNLHRQNKISLRNEWMIIYPLSSYKKLFEDNISCTDLYICIDFKVLNQLNNIGDTKKVTKNKCSKCMKDNLKLIENLSENASQSQTKIQIYTGPSGTTRLSIHLT